MDYGLSAIWIKTSANESLAKTINTHECLFSQIGLETRYYLIIINVKVMPKQIIY